MDDKTNREYLIISEEIAFQGYFRLLKIKLKHRLFNGDWSNLLTRELFQRSNCIAVIPYDPITDQVVLIEQFRTGPLLSDDPKWMLEIVAGAIEKDERPEQVAHRETMEETGCKILKLKRVTEFYTSPGGASEKLVLYCAQVDATHAGGIHGNNNENEDILVHVVSFTQAMEKVENGMINSAIPILALQWLALNRQQVREEWLTT